MNIPTLEAFLFESNALQGAVDDFAASLPHRADLGTPYRDWMTEPGACSMIASELRDFLVARLIPVGKFVVATFDRDVFPSDDGRWHTALRVGDRIVDLSIGQFSKRPEAFIGTDSEWRRKLELYTHSRVLGIE